MPRGLNSTQQNGCTFDYDWANSNPDFFREQNAKKTNVLYLGSQKMLQEIVANASL